jgi:hypothetical protein
VVEFVTASYQDRPPSLEYSDKDLDAEGRRRHVVVRFNDLFDSEF